MQRSKITALPQKTPCVPAGTVRIYTYTGPRVPRRTGAHGLPRSRFPRPPCPAPGFGLPFSDAQGSILQLSVTIFVILMCLCRSGWHPYWISLRAECIFEYPKTKYMTLGPKFFFCNKMITARRPMDLFEIWDLILKAGIEIYNLAVSKHDLKPFF